MTIYGWDLSHYDDPDSRGAIAEGFSFLTHKAGGDVPDAEYGTWWNLMQGYRNQVLLGAYWVLYPGNPAGRADAFLARLDDQSPGWRDGPFILQADCEIWGGNTATRPSKAEIQAFCDRLAAEMPRLRPIVYAPKWAYDDKGVSLAGLTYPLWSSRYVPGSGYASVLYPGDGSSLWGAYSGQTPAILQFTSSAVIAGQTTCDANAYRGTLAQLTALLAPGWSNHMPLDTTDLGKIEAIVQKYVGDVVPRYDPTGKLIPDTDPNPRMWVASALGYTARDTALIRTQLQASQAALLAALQAAIAGVDDAAEIISAVQAESAKIQQQLAAGVPANVDVAMLATALAPALDALLPDVTVTPDVVEQAFRRAFSGTSAPAPAP